MTDLTGKAALTSVIERGNAIQKYGRILEHKRIDSYDIVTIMNFEISKERYVVSNSGFIILSELDGKIFRPDNSIMYIKNELIHRVDGPAVEKVGVFKEYSRYFINGIEYYIKEDFVNAIPEYEYEAFVMNIANFWVRK